MENGNKDYVPQSLSKAIDTDESGESAVKVKCKDQREALPGEPKCVVCGRYGEYICDETDDDICSMECKQSVLCKMANRNALPFDFPPPKKLPAADECFYVKDSNCSGSSSLTCEQTELLRRKLGIVIKGDIGCAPTLSFSSCNLPQKLLQNLETAGYEMPTAVQMQAIPAACLGKNLLVSAETGSGKTVSYLVPIVSYCARVRLENFHGEKKPLAMVLTPTRELCIQVEEQAKLLGKGMPFKTALVVGGDALAGQVYRIEQGVELIVATPGRLVDLLMKHDIEFDELKTFVLDEVDCLLQKGFRDQVLQIFTALSRPQILMYSATTSPEVEKMARTMGDGTVIITAGMSNKPTKALKQLVIWVESKNKKQKLFDILASKQHFMPPLVVYVGSRLGADLLSNAITVTTGIKALSIHGHKSMKERREAMKSFLVGDVQVMVATGILGRGMDLLRVRQVIVFDMPNSIKEYVHQIGRASRLGEEGKAIVFVNGENTNLFQDLVEILKSSGAPIPRELSNSHYAVNSSHTARNGRKRKYT
ncbi:DEAD-box ATP-dependent RNA helicase 41 [Cucurbita pepo subsp. pepo]|uniref:DEAD-box ATP-dependent RNA helicase 41 n=1 Tax=Cucurbita pepo subsp. pepo TaxID=3664 RepID=UPI000C9D4F30|nr:DEAD-box ATP-dependent RNA helicase 41 [Cucurbita pepo subsp. pepo]